jgi:hypothetical protein
MKGQSQLRVVIPSFYRSEYLSELDGMLVTIKEDAPSWSIVVGKGRVPGLDLQTVKVESPSGKRQWSLPVSTQNADDLNCGEKA